MLALAGCASSLVLEDTPDAVSVRYDGVATTLDGATAIANKACTAHGKVAQYRDTHMKAVLERIAHFSCVSG